MSVKAGQAQWDKRPPEVTRTQHQAAAAARHRAERFGWCKPLALDEDALDEPGYRLCSRYRQATGSGTAGSARRASALTRRPPPERLAYSVGEAAFVTGLSRDLL